MTTLPRDSNQQGVARASARNQECVTAGRLQAYVAEHADARVPQTSGQNLGTPGKGARTFGPETTPTSAYI
jgi:hypothetical protein